VVSLSIPSCGVLSGFFHIAFLFMSMTGKFRNKSTAGIFLESILRPNDPHNGFHTAKTLFGHAGNFEQTTSPNRSRRRLHTSRRRSRYMAGVEMIIPFPCQPLPEKKLILF
jgi:hypothetical protein